MSSSRCASEDSDDGHPPTLPHAHMCTPRTQVGVTFAPPDKGLDGVVTSTAAAGLAWRTAPGAPMLTNSLIPGGSTIKAFTATAAMSLVDRGLLDLDLPVSGLLEARIPASCPLSCSVRFCSTDSRVSMRDHDRHKHGHQSCNAFLSLLLLLLLMLLSVRTNAL
jgi:hypothetical protein